MGGSFKIGRAFGIDVKVHWSFFLLVLIAVFIYFGANGETQVVRQRELTRGLAVSDVIDTRPRLETVTPYHTFGQVLDSVI